MPGSETRIYIGNLPPDIRTKDVEDLFYKYGKIVFVDLKNKRGPPFAFVEFEDHRSEATPIMLFVVQHIMFCCSGMRRTPCMPAMVTTMTATDSGWSFPRAGAAASEAGWAGGAGAEVSQLMT